MKRNIIKNNEASAIPLILFIITIICCGALYTLFFLEIGFPTLDSFIPASDSKTFIYMLFYAIPLFLLIVGLIALMTSALKSRFTAGGYQ